MVIIMGVDVGFHIQTTCGTLLSNTIQVSLASRYLLARVTSILALLLIFNGYYETAKVVTLVRFC